MRYTATHTHIDKVLARPDNGDTIGMSIDKLRQEVVLDIKAGLTYVTITKGADGNWHRGQPVHIIKVNGTEYIKTADNGKEADNLENLPEF